MRDGEIREYAQIMKECGLQRLTVTENGRSVCLERSVPEAAGDAISAQGTGHIPAAAAPGGFLAPRAVTTAVPEQDGRQYPEEQGFSSDIYEDALQDGKVRQEQFPSESRVVFKARPKMSSVSTAANALHSTSVTSPLVGIFYAAPAENKDPFVKVGDTVQKGDSLCIIEAMKLMNEIRAEESGVITEICVTNGQIVEYGTELFKIGAGA